MRTFQTTQRKHSLFNKETENEKKKKFETCKIKNLLINCMPVATTWVIL